MESTKKIIPDAIKVFNQYRSPEAEAKLVSFDGNRLVIEFRGPFCVSCGVYDYFEDFIYELKRISNIPIEIESFESKPESFRVTYLL
ncbi:MAG: hypothetical protein ABIH76_06695 [Candidatus Bathyarchaeota archaeon]